MDRITVIYKGDVYREITLFPNYFISSGGKIFSLKTRKVLDGYRINSGHYMIKLRNGSEKAKNCYIHRLVADAWVDNPDKLPIVHHKNGDISNNDFTNLEWISADDHKAAMPYYGKKRRQILYDGTVYNSFRELAENLNISIKTAYNWRDTGKITLLP